MSTSKGNPWVLLVMNLVLSGVFATVVVKGLALIDLVTFTWRTVAMATLVLMLLTFIVVR